MLTSVFVIVGVAVAAVAAMFGMGWWLDRYHSHDVEEPVPPEAAPTSRTGDPEAR